MSDKGRARLPGTERAKVRPRSSVAAGLRSRGAGRRARAEAVGNSMDRAGAERVANSVRERARSGGEFANLRPARSLATLSRVNLEREYQS
jgi:hypothetical protein